MQVGSHVPLRRCIDQGLQTDEAGNLVALDLLIM